MKKHDYNRLLTRVVTAVLISFFIGGMIWGASVVLEMEGVYEPYVPAEGRSERPVTAAEIAAYLDTALEQAAEEKTAVSSSEKFRLDEDSFSVMPDSELTVSAMKYIHEDFEELIEESFEKPSVAFGEAYNGILAPLSLGEADIASAECLCEYYECPICGETEDEIPEVCDECGTTEPYEERLSDEYKISIVFTAAPAGVKEYLELCTQEDIDAVGSHAAGLLTIGETDIEYTKLSVYAVVNRMTDRVTRIEFNKDAQAKADISFCGDYEALGMRSAAFSYTDSLRYDIAYPGIDIDKSSVVLEHKKTEVLKAALTCDDPTAYTVKWESSDNEVASVDEGGVVKAGKADGEAIITASYEFNGVTYTDSCNISVRTPVEKADISKRSLTLAVGGEYTLEATVSPRKASVKTVKWYSSDENIATVDSNGRITAIAEGSANVFAVSDDGHHKATCTVEVTQ